MRGRRVAPDQDDVAGEKSVCGIKKICYSVDRGQLNGDPEFPRSPQPS